MPASSQQHLGLREIAWGGGTAITLETTPGRIGKHRHHPRDASAEQTGSPIASWTPMIQFSAALAS